MDIDDSCLVLVGPIRLARGTAGCWHCSQDIEVVALVASSVLEMMDGVEEVVAESSTFVYDVNDDDMPAALVEALATAAPHYVPKYSGTMRSTSWANRCVHCSALQGAFYLHDEPDGVFFGGASHRLGECEILHPGSVTVTDASYTVIT